MDESPCLLNTGMTVYRWVGIQTQVRQLGGECTYLQSSLQPVISTSQTNYKFLPNSAPIEHQASELSKLSPSFKTWWCLVKSFSGVCSPSTRSLFSNGTTANSTREKAECLNSVFASKYCVPKSRGPPYPTQSYPTAPRLCLLHLRRWITFWRPPGSYSSTGPDDISSRVLKSCSDAIALPLSALFTLSFT